MRTKPLKNLTAAADRQINFKIFPANRDVVTTNKLTDDSIYIVWKTTNWRSSLIPMHLRQATEILKDRFWRLVRTIVGFSTVTPRMRIKYLQLYILYYKIYLILLSFLF